MILTKQFLQQLEAHLAGLETYHYHRALSLLFICTKAVLKLLPVSSLNKDQR